MDLYRKVQPAFRLGLIRKHDNNPRTLPPLSDILTICQSTVLHTSGVQLTLTTSAIGFARRQDSSPRTE